MERSKCRGSAKLAVLLAVVLAVGAFAYRAHARGPWGGERPEPGERIEVMAKLMDLSPEQESKIKDIIADSAKKREELRQKHQPTLDAFRAESLKLRDESRASIEALLNDNQREKFKALSEFRGGFGPGRSGGAGCGDCDASGRGPGEGRRCGNW